jgi:hypothetical protein
MFTLNQEEKNILKLLNGTEAGSARVDYYAVIEKLKLEGDTSVMIPVVERLEEDGYIRSDGLIYRYLYITEKGRREIGAE